MVHVLASVAFTLVAFATFALTAVMLATARGDILRALGVSHDPQPVMARRPVRVRSAGRWQSVSPVPTSRPRVAA